MHNSIVIKEAREHNLKNIDVTIPPESNRVWNRPWVKYSTKISVSMRTKLSGGNTYPILG